MKPNALFFLAPEKLTFWKYELVIWQRWTQHTMFTDLPVCTCGSEPNTVSWDREKKHLAEGQSLSLVVWVCHIKATGYWNRWQLGPGSGSLFGHLLVNLTSDPWWCQAGQLSSALPHIWETAAFSDLLSLLFSLVNIDPKVHITHSLVMHYHDFSSFLL